ncbi:MAG: glycoside hydrolase family 25 protein [Ruminococcus sp.]|nr:glycoside hydrolase family 25 protein [Ruminococcus sp.]MDY4909910.1 glycoside hydrolase family 25 protein [Candidatus Fimenecus sp.]
MSKGIDVSKHQGKIDWHRVKNSGVDFAILRAGYGKYDNQKDERFEENYSNAKNAGIKLGAYHYSYAKSVDDAKKEAEIFLKWISGKQFEYPVAFDVEEKSQSDKGKQFVSDVIRAFCETVEKAGYYVCVYSNKYWLDNYVDDDCKRKYDTWLAQWSDKATYGGNYGIWQYSSQGEIDGISGRVDLDESYKDYSLIIKSNGLNGFSGLEPVKDNKSYSPRMMVSLSNTPIYVSATTKTPATRKSGTFYIYDGIEVNGRYRITTSPTRAGKKPIGENVTGFINKSDIR